MHRATIIVEGTATAEQFTFAITRFWKGTTAATVKLTGIKPTADPCNAVYPTIPGTRYLLFIDSTEATTSASTAEFAGAASVYPADSVAGITQYLTRPLRVSRRDLLAMLKGWRDGTITDLAFALWLHDTTPLAEVDDWATFGEDGAETSLNLNVLRELNFRMVESGISLDEDPCEVTVLRTRVVPVLIQVLEAQHITPELIESLDQLPDDIELCK